MADFDFAGEGGDGAVIADVQPRSDFLGKFWRFNARAGSGFLKSGRVFSDGEDGDSRAEDFEEVAASQFELVERR